MESLALILIVLVVIGLALYALEKMPAPLSPAVKAWISCIVALIGAAYLAHRFLGLG